MSRLPGPLRAGANSSGSYTNGHHNTGTYAQYDGADDDGSRRPSAERRRRPGGYGGLAPDERDEDAPHVVRPTSLERRGESRRRSRDGSSRSGSRPGAGGFGAGSQQMEDILQYIKDNWDFMTNEKCVPVEVALKLMDSSSLGLASQNARFQNTHQELQRALKSIVNEHHQGFNSSIGTFHKIQSSLQQSQHRVRALKDSLAQAKTHLSTTKPELKELATASQNYDEMIQVLSTIEQLQLVPDKLEARISEKRFLTAVDILQDALRMIRKSEMENIGALSDLRIYLSNQEHSLTDILIEELHNHLYLKSPYCEDRWKVYAQNQSKGELSERAQTDIRGRLMYHFLDGLDTSEPMADNSPRNPEADTFQYIRLIVESLNKMNRLDIAVDTIEQRLPVELFKVVERSNNEVAQRHPSMLRAYAARKGGKSNSGIDSDDLRTALLNDLLWTLYARFEAIAESHRVVHDIVSGIVRREGIRESSSATLTRGFKELWKLYQSEIRSLLHDYLATDGDLSYRGGQGQSSGGSAFSRAPRDRNKRMFKLTDVDTKSTELTTEREDLEFILKSSVPGLVSDSKRPDDMSTSDSTNLDGSATGHKLLVQPSVFNMGILLPPSLEFLNRLKEVVPPNSDIVMSTLTSFLDDFLVNVFHPQLDETLIELCAQTFIELDAFQEDHQWTQHSKKPIFKGTAKFFTLITAFCKMLDNLPHDQAFSQLIITQMTTYAAKCNGWYKALVSRGHANVNGRRVKAPAAFAESGEIAEAISSLFQADPKQAPEVLDKEISLLLAGVENDPLDEADLIREKKSVTSLCLLYTSMKWLATKIAQLRHISDRTSDSTRPEPSGQRHNRRWTLLTSAEPRTDGVPVYLPLNQETAADFDAVLRNYQTLSAAVLRTLHLSIRTTILHSLTTSIKRTYTLDALLDNPDPAILALNTSLVSFDTIITTYIPPPQHPLITTGLAPLMDAYLLHLSSRITSLNPNGAKLMQLNILVLQQNLKNIEPDAELPYAALFFDLYTEGPDAIVARAKRYGKTFGVPQERFGQAAVEGLLRLTYGERLRDERREVGVQAKRAMDGQLLEVSEYMY
ncbi:Sec8 exocyst complex component-specific domain-containing protein [Massariosphaeria phaeospora]|uniref:Exocyst complex component Sec8 n=1 Tax=Massariosphaeria phaeospora TaxID=100035 RepID=A0A7C8MB37_9PLEO|nr:Sec8 exocyst complex component-specific domain-containing protein [Massariosphaeria phaeospora]